MLVGVPVATRTTAPPKLSEEEQAAFMKKVQELGAEVQDGAAEGSLRPFLRRLAGGARCQLGGLREEQRAKGFDVSALLRACGPGQRERARELEAFDVGLLQRTEGELIPHGPSARQR